MKKIFFIIFIMLIANANATEVKLSANGGVYTLPIMFNDTIILHGILDSGASEVLIPIDVASVLIRAGTIDNEDQLSSGQYKIGDGSILNQKRVNIKKLTIGDTDFYNVTATISKNLESDILLGQSFLNRLSSWSINNKAHSFIFSTEEDKNTKAIKSEVISINHQDDWTVWAKNDENDITTMATDIPCKYPDLMDKSLEYYIFQSIPFSRVKRQTQIIDKSSDGTRAITVIGCWSPLQHKAILIRHEDKKTWEINDFHVTNLWSISYISKSKN